MARPVVIGLGFAIAGCGLGVVGSALVPGATPNADAGNVDATAADAEPLDAGAAVEAGGCTLLVDDDFSHPDPRWIPQGDALFANDEAVLVLPQLQHHGAIVMKVPGDTPVTSFEASFQMLVQPDAGDTMPADGIALGWIANSEDPPPIGGSGGSLAFCPDGNVPVGPRGAALGLHVIHDGSGVFTRESDGGNCIGPDVTKFDFGLKEEVSVAVNGRDVDASVSGTPFQFKLVSSVPIRWIGLYAATGGAVALFSVDDVKITICP